LHGRRHHAFAARDFAAALDAGHAFFGLDDLEFDAPILFPGGGVECGSSGQYSP